ncbi:hypothetical protein BGX21_011078 [Mortierella sp. AD011]|nr:hypothetical protein BGX20_006764 [Mortierella sp. AD010]KAF9402138.1 hypothetical protein BGX21_011078 [Mortierella sp. AD011]
MVLSVNPLEIHEIVANVGRFVKLWDYWDHQKRCPRDKPGFLSKEFLSYTLISKTWRSALLPICWQIYDGRVMSRVPDDIITKYSYFFTSIINCKHRGPFYCNNLRMLETQDVNVYCYKMIKELQPPISELNWITYYGYRDARARLDLTDEVKDDTIKLSMIGTAITRLRLIDWVIDNVPQLLEFLTRYNRLSNLSLDNLHDIHDFPYSGLSMENTSLPRPYVVLPGITVLRLDCSYQVSKSIIEFITCCPNLTHLEIEGSWMSNECAYKDVPFYRYCPNLRSFSIELPEMDQNSGMYVPYGSDLAELIACLVGPPGTGKLDTFEGKLVDFSETTSKALVNHARDTLEVFKLELGETSDFEINLGSHRGVNHILMSCHRLKSISLRYNTNCDFIGEFEGPWACLDTLEELDIHGGWFGTTHEEIEDAEVDYGDDGIWIWHSEDKMPLELWDNIFSHVKQMVNLRRLYINDKRIYKIKDY